MASSNNGAVENVSTEIPGPKGIDGQWRDAAATVDYFSQTVGQDAWAMIAARLGKRANRAAFVQDFWWNRDSGMQNVLRQTAAPRPDWQSAVTSFRRALSRVKALSARRSVVSHSINRLPVASRDRAQADADHESAIALREELETEQQDADRRLREADDRWQMAIRSATSNGHWIPAEGAELRSVHSQLRDAGVGAAQIRVISPFRMVVGQAMKVHESVFPRVSGRDRENWVGTVHVMQGKEADVVVLVLGGNPDRPGAREFATREPNLLNVAVTRAKRRLYVIGNRDTWGNEPYFNVLAARIPAGYPASDVC